MPSVFPHKITESDSDESRGRSSSATAKSTTGSKSSELAIDNVDHVVALQAALCEEIDQLKDANQQQILELKENHDDAKQMIKRHCKQLQESVLRRENALLKEIDELEKSQIRQLDRKDVALNDLKNEAVKSTTSLDTTRIKDHLAMFSVSNSEDMDKKKSNLTSFKPKLTDFDSSNSIHVRDLQNLRRKLSQRILKKDVIDVDFEDSTLIGLIENWGNVTLKDDIFYAYQPYFGKSAYQVQRRPSRLNDDRNVDIPEKIKKNLTLVSGCAAGMTSATMTHGLDVAKVLRQVGKRYSICQNMFPDSPSSTFRGYFTGMPMGALAQGQRFGVTLFVDRALQKELNKFNSHPVMSFFGSMFAAGVGEFLANPPVVVKNFQIAHAKPNAIGAISIIHRVHGFQGFSRGVIAGVARKSLANGIVLQTIGPTKAFFAPYCVKADSKGEPGQQTLFQKVGIGFVAGSVTGSFAEVATNYPDRIKTLMQTKNISLYDSALEAARDPFRGAMWAGLRKGVIRGINWGSLGLFTTLFEDTYVKYFHKPLSL